MSARAVFLLSTLLLASLAAPPAQPAARAEPAAHTDASAQVDPRVKIASRIPDTRPDDLRPSPIAGIYELSRGMDFAYVTADGKYAFSGDLIDLGANDNLTEQRRRDARHKLIDAIPESDMIIFGPRDPKYTVTVFTDVDCAYCRELHRQIAEYNRLGIRVRYLSYPRTGPNSDSWTKAEEVWCSRNRGEALTEAKRGMALATKPCANNPVAREYALGQEFQLKGTPAIVMSDGELYGGYLPPGMLAAHLMEAQKR